MIKTSDLPKNFEEFLLCDYEDGFKYEWFEGKIMPFGGRNKHFLSIYSKLVNLLIEKNYWKIGIFICKQDVIIGDNQLRRPDIAYFTKFQIQNCKNGVDEISEFIIEIISENDKAHDVEVKLTEYFKVGIAVVWVIIPEHKLVYVYTYRKTVKICMDDDICSAAPVLPEFDIRVSDIFG